ncbi:MAG: 4Fe-4S ferredoxin [Chloroflexi bacterium 44-23]|nr:MAG: 4Fe-4S ferredoxin [Chloroflexi bacterium 44-23]
MPSLIKPSTRAFYKTWKAQPNHRLSQLLHGLFYSSFPYFYIGFGIGTHPLRKRVAFLEPLLNRLFPPHPMRSSEHGLSQASHTHADGYHGKVLPLNTARELISVKEPIRKPDLEQVIPYTQARAILQQDPDHIAVMDCPCRAYKEDPCLPMDVCLIIGEPFASFIIEHQPKHSRWITQTEAIRILEQEDQRGHVHHAFFKEAMLDRFYAICNCCECCCGAIKFHSMGTPMLVSSGYLAVIEETECIACGTCIDTCQFHALSLDETGAFAVVDYEACMGCGICVGQCSQQAIELVLEPAKGVPLIVDS